MVQADTKRIIQQHQAFEPIGKAEQEALYDKIKIQLEREDAVIVAHYYTDPMIQALAEQTGGFVSDSLEMARFGKAHAASTLLVVGVRFMGETAKILSPSKRVIMPTLEATCSLDLGCPADEFRTFCQQHPERTVVVYANTSAEVKAQADWIVTSSCAVDIVEHLIDQDQPMIWAPDKHLGLYIQEKTGADMLLWDGSCIVHDEFKAEGVKDMLKVYPDAAVLVHPESPKEVIALADVVGSTTALIKAAKSLPNKTFIVATDRGIFYKMQQVAGPDKELISAPTAGKGATCRSCARCPWMGMNSLRNISQVLDNGDQEIIIDPVVREQALLPLSRMMQFTEKH